MYEEAGNGNLEDNIEDGVMRRVNPELLHGRRARRRLVQNVFAPRL